VVIKYGGNAMTSEKLKSDVISDIVLLSLVGIKVVLVHGGGPEINDMLKKIGKEPKFINGLRYTDAETMDVVQMVLCGKVNKDLVTLIERRGGGGIGLCGLDGGMLKADRLTESGVDYLELPSRPGHRDHRPGRRAGAGRRHGGAGKRRKSL
jgi:acetylglutamate kinase